MFSWHEYAGRASYHKTGVIEINAHYYTRRKPAWLILSKLLGLAAMVAVGFAIAVPTLRSYLPMWQVISLIAGVMFIYTGIAFFVRPEPNGDNMGLLGGMNDPFQYSDNINRGLWTCAPMPESPRAKKCLKPLRIQRAWRLKIQRTTIQSSTIRWTGPDRRN